MGKPAEFASGKRPGPTALKQIAQGMVPDNYVVRATSPYSGQLIVTAKDSTDYSEADPIIVQPYFNPEGLVLLTNIDGIRVGVARAIQTPVGVVEVCQATARELRRCMLSATRIRRLKEEGPTKLAPDEEQMYPFLPVI